MVLEASVHPGSPEHGKTVDMLPCVAWAWAWPCPQPCPRGITAQVTGMVPELSASYPAAAGGGFAAAGDDDSCHSWAQMLHPGSSVSSMETLTLHTRCRAQNRLWWPRGRARWCRARSGGPPRSLSTDSLPSCRYFQHLEPPRAHRDPTCCLPRVASAAARG